MVSVIGRDLTGLGVMLEGLKALDASGVEPLASQETGRGVDVQFLVRSEDLEKAVKALHRAFIEEGEETLKEAA